MRWALVFAALGCVTIALFSEFLRLSSTAACLAGAALGANSCAPAPGPSELAISLAVEATVLALTVREVLAARR